MQQNQPDVTGQYVFISGHTDGANAPLSNWYRLGFTIDNIRYPTAEHYMMAEKARLFNDQATLQLILACATPKEAKALGRKVKNFDEPRWVEHRMDIMMRALRAKAAEHDLVHDLVIGSHPHTIAEAAPWDTIWGIGLAPTDPLAQDPTKWKGTNLLGIAYMQLRDELRAN